MAMRRRAFLAGLGSAAAWPMAARAQQPAPTRQVTVWMGRAPDAEGLRLSNAFGQQFQALGWAEGRNVRIDYRWVAGDIDRTRLANEVIGQQPDAIVVETTAGVTALASQSRGIPLIFVNVSDPIGGGFVANLARPGGTITGFMSNEPTLGGKWPEMIKEIVPGITRVGFLFNPNTSPYAGVFMRHAEASALAIGVKLAATPFQDDADIEQAMIGLSGEPGSGLIVLPELTTNVRSDLIIALAARYHLPAIYAYRFQATRGGLISYGVDLADSFRGAATYVDRILRGEKPGDLPVQAPTKFVLVVNLKTAKALGLTIPESFLVRADEVIE